ncbi:hypothetical protein [Paenibacillus amylolyticus]|uniref:hypothetical protein n=1 Tax=Paenibacillus amylolyticus TaxID=1451 RepID=UPI000B888D54|nr:hypothetical protein [Paenibacillus amylolyticus]
MEDQLEVQETGVEDASVAGMQQETVEDHTQSEQMDTNTGVEESDVAGQSDEKGFAKALKAREEQIRSQLEKEYGTKAQEAERYQQMLNRTAKYYGFDDHEAYMTALDQAEMDKRIEEEAILLGVDESVIREYVEPMKKELNELKSRDAERAERDMVAKIEAQISGMEQDSVNFPDFGKHKNDVLNLAASKGYTLDDAYKIVTYDARIDTARAQAEQEAIRKLQQNADSSTGSLGADAPELAGGYEGMSSSERKAFRERVKAGQAQI